LQAKFEALITGYLADDYATCEDFFDLNLIASLRKNLQKGHANGIMHQAGVGKQASFQQNLKVRGDLISWMENDSVEPSELAFMAIVKAFYGYLNQTCYTGINGSEFHNALYETGSFYKRHMDQFKLDSNRQFSMVTYLNEDWLDTDGGELVLYLDGKEIIIRPQGGRVVFFKADKIEHEVRPASRERMSIAGWLLCA
jgi:SM-20-related protein